jgi:hypothetical protein
MAVLKVVADEVAEKGACALTLGELSARAGCCRSTSQNALRSAARAGLIIIEERRRRGQKNLSNLIHVVSKEWLTWLARGERRRGGMPSPGIGFKKFAPTDRQDKKLSIKGAATSGGEGNLRNREESEATVMPGHSRLSEVELKSVEGSFWPTWPETPGEAALKRMTTRLYRLSQGERHAGG